MGQIIVKIQSLKTLCHVTKSTFEKKKKIYGRHNVLRLGQRPEVLCLNTILFDCLKGFRCPGEWDFFH